MTWFSRVSNCRVVALANHNAHFWMADWMEALLGGTLVAWVAWAILSTCCCLMLRVPYGKPWRLREATSVMVTTCAHEPGS